MSRRTRILVALIASICYSFYMWRTFRAQKSVWDSVPQNHYEQILAQMDAHSKGQFHIALDEPQVLASVQEWLNSLGKD